MRMGTSPRKQFLTLGDRPILAHTIGKFEICEAIDEIVVTVPPGMIAYTRKNVIKPYSFVKVSAVVKGGEHRQDSVYKGFKVISEDTKIVVVHDGVRPFVSPEKIEEVVSLCEKYDAVITGIRSRDTVKQTYRKFVKKTLERDSILLAHTPQAFKRDIIEKAFKKALMEGFYGTDEAALVEGLGIKVYVVTDEETNIKITSFQDLEIANWLLERFEMQKGS